MKSAPAVEQAFYLYLDRQFGQGFSQLIAPPDGYKIGERVLYTLEGGDEAVRNEDTSQSDAEIKRVLEDVVDKIDGARVVNEPVVSSGLPYPRLIDVPYASDFLLGDLSERYAQSDELLPSPDFPVVWVFGVLFGYSAKQLLYLDFRHPKAKAVFCVAYDDENDVTAGRHMRSQLASFIARQKQVSALAEERADVHWAKLFQVNAQGLLLLRTRRGRIERRLNEGNDEPTLTT